MKKSLVLSMLAAVVLTGCGGGGGGGGGSSSPAPVIKYNLQFVEFRDYVDGTTDPSCTLFDTDRQTPGMESYANPASTEDVMVKIFDAQGDFVKSLPVSNKGLLSVSVNDVPDDGYVSVIDSPSDYDPLYKVLSIQKSLLSDSLIAVKRNQITTGCYKGEKETRVIKTGKASVDTPDFSANGFAFNSSQTNITKQSGSSKEVDAFKDENVLVRAYNNDDFVGYKFISTLTDADNPSITPEILDAVDNKKRDWSIQLPVNKLKRLSIRLNKNDFSYPWIDEVKFMPTTGATTKFAYVATEGNWSYNTLGKHLGWVFEQNAALDASLDVNLSDDITLSDNPSVVQQTGDNYEFNAQGISSKRLQRSAYYKGVDVDGKTRTLEHSIYSEVASGNHVVIPKLGLTSLDPIGATNIKVNILSSDTITSDLKTFFMRENAANDLVSVVLSPAKTVAHDKVKYMSNYTLLSR